MILSELLSFLETLGVAPKKGLSQNFLIDPNIVRKIVRTAEVKPGDRVLEIGPGPGALTQELLAAGATVIAIEQDPVLARALHRLQTGDRRLHVHTADALTFPLETISAEKVVANLPYHITTPLLERLFTFPCLSITVMVQKEFGARLAAKAGTKEFGSLTLFAEMYTKVADLFPVSSACFYPKPSVDSSVIRLDRHAPLLADPEPFFRLTRRAFQQRRKCLSTSLRETFPTPHTQNMLETLGIRKDARPEMLSLNDWLRFFDQTNLALSPRK